MSRFELVSLHVWMCLARLRADGSDGAKLSQELFDNFWDDMMNEIRHKGVKELSVNKHLVELQERHDAGVERNLHCARSLTRWAR